MVTASSAEGGDGPGEENGSPGVRPDTLQMKARAPVRADSLRPARTLLQLLASRYADSPQAARAQSMLEAMPEPVDSARGRPAAGDSVMADTALADTALADTAAADTAAAGAGDAAAVAADTSRASPRPAPDAQSDGPPNASTPTPDSASAPRRWAILVGPFPDRRAAGQRRDSLQATGAGGYALRVRPDTAAASYDVVIGTFESQREAAAARVRLREVLPEASRLTRVAADSTAASGRSE
jgi:cell division protein FtsN